MASVSTAVAAPLEPDAWVRVLTVGGITFGVLFVVLLLVGVALLFRRRGGRDDEASRALETRANILLVRVDDEVAASEDELGFAVAQFGDETTRSFAATLQRAKEQLTEAFALQQRLDDATPESETQRRAWVLRIIQLCENAATDLADERSHYELLRRRERNAPRDLQELRRLIAEVREAAPAATATLTRLTAQFQPSALGGVSDNATEAEQLLGDADKAADTAEAALARDHTSLVADTLRSGREAAERASELLAAVDRRASALEAAAAQVQQQIAAARADLEEARAVRDTAPDADSGSAVAAAMTGLEAALASVEAQEPPRDPLAESVRLRPAFDALDTALAGARNQQQRLEHAAAALTGALSIAQSQLETTRDLVNSARSRIGVEARTRLAEADRQLMLAKAEADPIAALDTARRSATLSRDADALARYDLMGAAVTRR